MIFFNKTVSKLIISSLIILLHQTSLAAKLEDVLRYPDSDVTLNKRWAWAEQQAKTPNFKNGYWIAYSIDKLMSKKSVTGSFNSNWQDKATLHEIIYGLQNKSVDENLTDAEIIRKSAREAIGMMNADKHTQTKVLKELVFLFHYTSYSKINNLKISNASLQFDLKNEPLIWLGKVQDTESLTKLIHHYKKATLTEVKEKLVSAAGMHPQSSPLTTFLINILHSNENDKVREKTTFWLGQQDSKEALNVLVNAANKDRCLKIRKKAVFAISQLNLPAKENALIGIAKNSDNAEIQEKAVFWLGQIDSPKVLKALEKLIRTNPRIAEKAVFAISEMNVEGAVDILIKLAETSKNSKVAKQAVFWLGQKASRKCSEALRKVAFKNDDYEIQKEAVFAISQFPVDKRIPALIDICKTHPDYKIRKKAIFWLGETGDKRAIRVLAEIVKN